MKYNKEFIVSSCRHCPFLKTFGSSNPMECRHPYYDKSLPYANCIITQENIDRFPAPCPLVVEKGSELTTTYTIRHES